jgi:hypothetical protein
MRIASGAERPLAAEVDPNVIDQSGFLDMRGHIEIRRQLSQARNELSKTNQVEPFRLE